MLWPQVAAQPLKEDSSEERRTESKYSLGRKATASRGREGREGGCKLLLNHLFSCHFKGIQALLEHVL